MSESPMSYFKIPPEDTDLPFNVFMEAVFQGCSPLAEGKVYENILFTTDNDYFMRYDSAANSFDMKRIKYKSIKANGKRLAASCDAGLSIMLSKKDEIIRSESCRCSDNILNGIKFLVDVVKFVKSHRVPSYMNFGVCAFSLKDVQTGVLYEFSKTIE